ncbi:hypothetical protein ANACOL_00726 [Anaerotruncus colihominis DSM 17241]|uniref:Uncharacterized protein n=1 Tax=Anaerotruncus colihominis DSM 17241 TaxID=445972 RepID=B0P7J1_9FIRM|nr:hypothetical protein ANACOL_00726 [Anaerotruncus colihominis DSM 17241]
MKTYKSGGQKGRTAAPSGPFGRRFSADPVRCFGQMRFFECFKCEYARA